MSSSAASMTGLSDADRNMSKQAALNFLAKSLEKKISTENMSSSQPPRIPERPQSQLNFNEHISSSSKKTYSQCDVEIPPLDKEKLASFQLKLESNGGSNSFHKPPVSSKPTVTRQPPDPPPSSLKPKQSPPSRPAPPRTKPDPPRKPRPLDSTVAFVGGIPVPPRRPEPPHSKPEQSWKQLPNPPVAQNKSFTSLGKPSPSQNPSFHKARSIFQNKVEEPPGIVVSDVRNRWGSPDLEQSLSEPNTPLYKSTSIMSSAGKLGEMVDGKPSTLTRSRSLSYSSVDSARLRERGTSSSPPRAEKRGFLSFLSRSTAVSPSAIRKNSVQNKGSNQVDGKEKSKKLSPRSTVVRRGSDDEKSIEDSEDFRTKGLKHVPLLKSGIFHHEKPEWRLQRFSDEYPQLFEYILIVEIEKDAQNGHLKPVITYQFPKKEDHYMAKGDVLLSQIPQFCFPDLENIKSSKKSERFSFVLTDITGSRRFGYCRRIKRGHPYPEVFCIISPLGCFEMYDKILDEIEQRRVVSRNAVFTFLKAIYNNPFPAPGRTVAVKVFSPTGKGKSLESEEIQFTRPMSSRLEHVDFGELFMTTTVKKVIYMFSSLLLERRVILTAKKLSSLTSCCHAMAALLYPLSWQHVYIPVLPNAVIDMVCSPTPFFVGISPQAARKMESMDVEDVLMVDLDSSKRLMKIGDEDALLPSYVMSFLVDSLESLLSSTPESKRTNSEEFNSQVSDIFLQVLVYFLGRAPSYLHRSEDGFSFQQNSYLDSLHGAAEKEFMRVVTTTQMFDRFLEERENAIMRGKPLNGHFEQKVEEFGSLPLNPEQYFRVEGRSKKKSGIFFKAKH